ncbi:Yip1-domain-containing protein [Ramaria rubella]|nr:Yip1-domain-containing protein [Ramaria rubella]
MAYHAIEPDEQLEAGPESLEFKSFLGDEGAANSSQNPQTSGSTSRGRLGPQGMRGVLMNIAGYYGEQPPTGSSGFWTIEYYQKYFDVDTKMVLTRCYTTLLPMSSTYLTTHLTPSVDLYGPFWTLTTVIFSLFVFSSLASSVSSYLSSTPITYDFQLLSIAVTLVYTYGLGIPIILWVVLRYIGIGEWSPVEAVAVFGYGQFVWIPVSILCVIPVAILRWVLVGVAFLLSGYFLVANIYPILASAEQKATRLLVIILVVLHAALALTFKVLFFSYYVVEEIGAKDPLGEVGSGSSSSAISNTAAALL